MLNLTRLRAKTKVKTRYLRDFLFADDAAVATHSAEDRFSKACKDFELTISQKKTEVKGHDPPSIEIA